MDKSQKKIEPSKAKGAAFGGLSAFFFLLSLQAVGGFFTNPGDWVFLLIALGITGSFSGHFGHQAYLHFYVYPEKYRKLTENEKMHKIVQFARSQSGRVSALEVAMAAQLEIEESRVLLEKLVDRGLAEMHVTDAAAMIFVFPDFAQIEAPQQRHLE